MSIIYRAQHKKINKYVNISKTSKLCKHKHNTEKTCPARIYLFKVYNKNTKTRCEICLKVILKKLGHKVEKSKFVRYIYKSYSSGFCRSSQWTEYFPFILCTNIAPYL